MRRLSFEASALALLALLCAWASNALAGPARRLSWRHREVQAVPAIPPPAPAQGAAIPPPPQPATPIVASKPAPKTGSAHGLPKVDPAAEMAVRFPALTDAPQADIGAEDARWLHARGALFLDARRSALHAQGHIAGARCLSPWEDGLAAKVEQLAMFAASLNAPVVIYCAGGDCQDSHLLAQKLWLAGFRNLRIYAAGYSDWEGRRWPITKGEAP